MATKATKTRPASKPIAVLISDIHFSLASLSPAGVALRAAVTEANDRGLPLVIAGDLFDGKAILRAECVNAVITTLSGIKNRAYIIPGNHDLLNERSEDNSLLCLDSDRVAVLSATYALELGGAAALVVPYCSEPNTFSAILNENNHSIVIGHQGIVGALSHYAKDRSAIDPAALGKRRVILGHYHKRQDIGNISYLGSPYTITFGEADDGPKGYSILLSDGRLEFHPLSDIRKHVVVERTMENLFDSIPGVNPLIDLVWLKVSGTYSQLQALSKVKIGTALLGHTNFKFDKIVLPDDTEAARPKDETPMEALDALIDLTSETTEQKARLKSTAREVLRA